MTDDRFDPVDAPESKLDPADAWVAMPALDAPGPWTGVGPLTVFDDDGREPVPTDVLPWAAVCLLRLRRGPADQQRETLATGWLAGPRVVLTAGHNLHPGGGDHDAGWVREVIVQPGSAGARTPFGAQRTCVFASTRGWLDHHAREADLGALFLAHDFPGHPGHLLIDAPRDGQVCVAGYPHAIDAAQATGQTLYRHWGDLIENADGRLRYDVDTTRGQSGSPVLQRQGGGVVAIGVHGYGDEGTLADERGNAAVTLDARFDAALRSWLPRGGAPLPPSRRRPAS